MTCHDAHSPLAPLRRYSHKLMLLVEAVLSEVASFSVRPDRFAVQRCAPGACQAAFISPYLPTDGPQLVFAGVLMLVPNIIPDISAFDVAWLLVSKTWCTLHHTAP